MTAIGTGATVKILHLFWPLAGLLASAAGVQALRWIFQRPGEWKQLRAWFLAGLVVAAMLLAWRVSWRASPMGHRELLERHTGVDLPFWPRDMRFNDDDAGTIVASLRLSSAELALLPRGTEVSHSAAASLLRDANGGGLDLHTISHEAQLESTSRCERGWYSLLVMDRNHGQLWVALFYPSREGALPCVPG